MKQKLLRYLLISFLGILIAWGSFVTTSHATATSVDDQVNLFTSEEQAQLTTAATKLEERFKGNVYIVTTDSNQETPRFFSDDYLLQKIGADNNGVLLLLDMSQGEIYISTSGNMIDYLDDSRIESILDVVYEGMVADEYFQAASDFLSETDTYITKGVPGGHYRIDEETGKIIRYKVLTTTEIVIAVIVALVASGAFFALTISKYQLKLGGYKYPYREKTSLNLVDHQDRLINSFVTTRRIPKPTSNGGGGGGSSTHSHGGGTFGGGGRSF